MEASKLKFDAARASKLKGRNSAAKAVKKVRELKKLKASLREQGITGQQRPKKKQKRDGKIDSAQRERRAAALVEIREAFNPFEVKAPARPRKFDVASNRTLAGDAKDRIVGRPGVKKSYGEESRRKSLLPELHRRSKVGGILDRRIGENDPSMTTDERIQARFTREKERLRSDLFNLEDADGDGELTHLGQPLALDGDDFDEAMSQASSDLEDEGLGLKRKRPGVGAKDGVGGDAEEPERKKTKAEVMKEVISKSKLHKYERQQAKEDDEDLREELDRDMGDLMRTLRRQKPARSASPPADMHINPERAAMINGADRAAVEKDYDVRIGQMTLDRRAQPQDRTKTDEEKSRDEAERLQKLEENRLRRMRGEAESDSDEAISKPGNPDDDVYELDEGGDEAAEFGLATTDGTKPTLEVEDEDDFMIDEDLVANGSEIDSSDVSSDDSSEGSESDPEAGEEAAEDDDLVSGLLTEDERKTLFKIQQASVSSGNAQSDLPFTYPCPRDHRELLETFKDLSAPDLPVVIQRIRALYDLKLAPENKAKLSDFAYALVQHITHLGDDPSTPLPILETVIRHVHSLSRTFADSVSRAFRLELSVLADTNTLTPGRLALLTAIGTIYPTSDHFHEVVTPAITLMARWFALTTTRSATDFAYGAYLGALCVGYQQLSMRYIPELVSFTASALTSPLCPPESLLSYISNLERAMDLWADKLAFTEIFSPSIVSGLERCRHPAAKAALRRLKILLAQAKQRRRPLELHHHRPLPIKTAIPQFEENFNPDKHYDPDFARSEAGRLRAEYKRERKGAMRELRKDANFIAREQLREKRERDRAHEEKERRLIAEINAEEGRERKEYEREKKQRKTGR